MTKKVLIYILYGLMISITLGSGFLVGMLFITNKPFFDSINPFQIDGIPGTYIVVSGSMEPVIKTGGIVVSVPVSSYKAGDIVTFRSHSDPKVLVTHRIAAKFYSETSHQFMFYTKGDANKTFDTTEISQNQILGKTVFSFPYLGYAANSVKDPKIFILFVIIPATIIVYEELKYLKKEIAKFFKKISKQINDYSKSSTNDNGVDKTLIFVPVFGILILLSGVTGSFFTDFKTSQNNNFLTSNFPTPIPTALPTPSPIPIATNLVVNEVLYDTSTAQNISGRGGSSRGEFVEIYNPTGSGVVLTGWTLSDDNSSENLSGTIPSHGFLILTGGTEAEFRAIWAVPTDGSVIFNQASDNVIGNGFDNAGDRVQLKNGSTITDSVSWGGDTTYLSPAPPDVASGHSLERNPDGIDTNTASDFVDRSTPMPGL